MAELRVDRLQPLARLRELGDQTIMAMIRAASFWADCNRRRSASRRRNRRATTQRAAAALSTAMFPHE